MNSLPEKLFFFFFFLLLQPTYSDTQIYLFLLQLLVIYIIYIKENIFECFPISRIRLINYSLIVISIFVPRRFISSLEEKPIHEARIGPLSRLNIEYCVAVENARG